jgi:type VI secretion system protein
MREERLLERIRTWEMGSERRIKEDPRRIIDSILKHLRQLLNTKQGNVPIGEDYGTPDFTDFFITFPRTKMEPKREIEKAIRLAIQKYEPRLEGVRVNLIEKEEEEVYSYTDPLTLRFQIMGRLSDESRTQVFLETTVDYDGKIKVTG